MWLHNKKHEVSITFWNVPVEEDGGVRSKPSSIKTVDLKILIMDYGINFHQADYGLVKYQILTFQVSKQELEDNSFDIITGNTHFKHNDVDYIVYTILDYSDYSRTKLYECVGMREIHAY